MFRINKLKGFENVKEKYYVTTCGKVLTNSKNSKNLFLSAGINGKGYHQVVLYKSDGTKQRPYIHKLVALAFLKNEKDLEQVDHIDNNKNNNFLKNLSWISNKENSIKKVTIDKTSNAKLTDEQVVELRKLFYFEKISYQKFWEKFREDFNCISEKAMRYAIQGKSYFWVKLKVGDFNE